MNCYLHPERPAAKALNVPCAPGGKIWICAECAADPDILRKTFEKHAVAHYKAMRVFTAPPNPGN